MLQCANQQVRSQLATMRMAHHKAIKAAPILAPSAANICLYSRKQTKHVGSERLFRFSILCRKPLSGLPDPKGAHVPRECPLRQSDTMAILWYRLMRTIDWSIPKSSNVSYFFLLSVKPSVGKISHDNSKRHLFPAWGQKRHFGADS